MTTDSDLTSLASRARRIAIGRPDRSQTSPTLAPLMDDVRLEVDPRCQVGRPGHNQGASSGREGGSGSKPSRLKVLPPSVSPSQTRRCFWHCSMRCLRGATCSRGWRYSGLVIPGDLLFAGVQMVGPLTMNNATARGRSIIAALSIGISGTARDTEVTGPQMGEMLVAAAVRAEPHQQCASPSAAGGANQPLRSSAGLCT